MKIKRKRFYTSRNTNYHHYHRLLTLNLEKRSAGRKFTYKQELEKMKELGVDTKIQLYLLGLKYYLL